jgi:hypothetical protein
VSAFLIALAVPFLLVFTAVVRERLAAGGASSRVQWVLQGAGTAYAVTLLVGAALYGAVPAARVFSRAPAPSPDVSRYFLGASYGALVAFSAFAAALFALTLSVGSIRSRAVPRWLAVAGFPFALLMLLNALLPMAAITVWFLVTSVTLTVRPASIATAVPTRAAPVPVPAG